ncbi:MAG TPA: pyridoxamine 5'-phosphate oxidase family protein [Aquihabitans sp.]|jgi:general stress protein 26|nr:pyridoxamine 5'-phosphate oxidase family protein [Aquihabitans sp.]
MTDETHDVTLPELVRGIRIAMLTTEGPLGLQGRPLSVQRVDDDGRVVWFLVGHDAPWLPSVTGPVNVAFVDDTSWISVSGTGSVTSEPAVLEDLGDPVSDAYFNEEAEPLALRVEVGHVDWWTAPGRLRQLAGFAKAIATDQAPDVGDRGAID